MAVITDDEVIKTITSLGGLGALVDNLGLTPKAVTDLRDADIRTLGQLLANFPKIAGRGGEARSEPTVAELTGFLKRHHLNGGMTFKLVVENPGEDPEDVAGSRYRD